MMEPETRGKGKGLEEKRAHQQEKDKSERVGDRRADSYGGKQMGG